MSAQRTAIRLTDVQPAHAWWRGLCFTLAVTVTFSTVPVPPPVWASNSAPTAAAQISSSQPAALDLAHLDVASLTVPDTLGHVVERWQPSPNSELSTLNSPAKLVIHLQDLHTHAEAQQHLSELIGYLHDHLGVSLVALEGAAGLCDTTLYSDLPDQIGRASCRERV